MTTFTKVVVILGLLLVGWVTWTQPDTEKEQLLAQVEAQQQVIDSLTHSARLNTDTAIVIRYVARTSLASADSLHQLSDSLGVLLGTSQNTADSLDVALRRIEVLGLEVDTLRATIRHWIRVDSLNGEAIRKLGMALDTSQDTVDSLTRYVQKSCPKIPVLGIPLPKVGIGYAATTGGQGVGVGVMVPIGKCR